VDWIVDWIFRAIPSNPLKDLVDLAGIEPATSSMPWNDKNRNLLTAQA
jgi:hypothetical protein